MLPGIAEDRDRGDNADTLAIVGGTGAYEATGTATVLSRRKSTRFRLEFARQR